MTKFYVAQEIEGLAEPEFHGQEGTRILWQVDTNDYEPDQLKELAEYIAKGKCIVIDFPKITQRRLGKKLYNLVQEAKEATKKKRIVANLVKRKRVRV